MTTLWPFFPNWSSAYRETYSFLTEIITSDDGTEQRRAWRNVARRRVSYDALVHRDRLRDFRRRLVGRVDPILFPDEVRRAHVAQIEPANSQGITVAETQSWLTPGSVVVLEEAFTRLRRTRTVDAVVDRRITFTDVSAQTWSSGSRIMPALTGRLSPTVNYTAMASEVATSAVDLDVEPGFEPSQATTPGSLFNGREVFTHRPNWSKPLDFQSVDPTVFVDYEIGVRHATRFVNFETTIIQQEHLVRSPAELNQVLGLFLRQHGRRGEFYAPSWLNDIALMEPTPAGGTTFVVAGHDVGRTYDSDPIHRSVAVRQGSDVQMFRIADIALSNSGAPRTFIHTLEPTTAMVDPGQATICWAPVCRFASDEMTVQWITDRLAQVVVNIQTVGKTP